MKILSFYHVHACTESFNMIEIDGLHKSHIWIIAISDRFLFINTKETAINDLGRLLVRRCMYTVNTVN